MGECGERRDGRKEVRERWRKGRRVEGVTEDVGEGEEDVGGEGVRGRRRRRVWSKKWEEGRSEGVRGVVATWSQRRESLGA